MAMRRLVVALIKDGRAALRKDGRAALRKDGRAFSSHIDNDGQIRRLFQEWCKKYGRTYSLAEESELQVFKKTYEFVKRSGRAISKDGMGAFIGGVDLKSVTLDHPDYHPDYLPASIDWRKLEAVARVRDQGEIATCWAYTAVDSVESAYQILTGSRVELSVQELIDCTDLYCPKEGGHLDSAFDYIMEHNGLCAEKDYPYEGKVGRRRELHELMGVERFGAIESYGDVPSSEEELKRAVARQPVCAVIVSNFTAFDTYNEGIFEGPWPEEEEPDHAVLVVGYGSRNGTDYWILKNSYGEQWGVEGGYMYLRRNTGYPDGLLKINYDALYPIVSYSW